MDRGGAFRLFVDASRLQIAERPFAASFAPNLPLQLAFPAKPQQSSQIWTSLHVNHTLTESNTETKTETKAQSSRHRVLQQIRVSVSELRSRSFSS